VVSKCGLQEKWSWLENPTNPLFFVKFRVFRGWNFGFRVEMGLRAGLGREGADFGFLNRSTQRGPIEGIFKRGIGRGFEVRGLRVADSRSRGHPAFTCTLAGGLGETALPDFDEAVALGDEGFDLREQRLEPLQQGTAAGIADSQPNNDRAGFGLVQALWKILVFGDDDRLVSDGVSPDWRIPGMPETDIGDVFGSMAMCL
jgi:hypothetical protein